MSCFTTCFDGYYEYSFINAKYEEVENNVTEEGKAELLAMVASFRNIVTTYDELVAIDCFVDTVNAWTPSVAFQAPAQQPASAPAMTPGDEFEENLGGGGSANA